MVDSIVRAVVFGVLGVVFLEVGLALARRVAKWASQVVFVKKEAEVASAVSGEVALINAAQGVLEAAIWRGVRDSGPPLVEGTSREAWLGLQQEVKRARARRLLEEKANPEAMKFALRELRELGEPEVELDLIAGVAESEDLDAELRSLAETVEEEIERRKARRKESSDRSILVD